MPPARGVARPDRHTGVGKRLLQERGGARLVCVGDTGLPTASQPGQAVAGLRSHCVQARTTPGHRNHLPLWAHGLGQEVDSST